MRQVYVAGGVQETQAADLSTGVVQFGNYQCASSSRHATWGLKIRQISAVSLDLHGMLSDDLQAKIKSDLKQNKTFKQKP